MNAESNGVLHNMIFKSRSKIYGEDGNHHNLFHVRMAVIFDDIIIRCHSSQNYHVADVHPSGKYLPRYLLNISEQKLSILKNSYRTYCQIRDYHDQSHLM